MNHSILKRAFFDIKIHANTDMHLESKVIYMD